MHCSKGFIAIRKPILTLTALALMSGCATMSDGNRTRAEAAGTGAVVGAVAGKLLGGSKESAMLGAMIGGAIGAAAGDMTAKQKEQYAKIEEQLRAVIASAEKTTAQAQKENENLAREIQAIKRRQEEILAKTSNVNAQNLALRADQKKSEQLIARNTKALAQLDQQLAYQHKIVEEQKQILAAQKLNASPELMAVVETRLVGLENERAALAASGEQLRSLDKRRDY